MMGRRAFLLGGLAKLCEPPRATAGIPNPVTARLIGPDGIRSEPVQFSARWAVPPLKFRVKNPGTWTKVELVQGGRTRTWDLYPSTATWTGDVLRVSGVVW